MAASRESEVSSGVGATSEPGSARDLMPAALGGALLVALFLVTLMPAHMLWDADEGYYARTAAEMLQSGDWLVPTYNGEIFAHKPPLSYWLMAIGLWLFGHGEFAVRFFSAPAMAASAFLTFLIGRRLFDDRVGLWAMAVLATSLLGVYLGFAAMLDAPLLLFVTLSIWAYVEMTVRPERAWPMIVVFGIGIFLSLLTKGPVGPAVVISMVAASWLLLPTAQRIPFRQGFALAVVSILALAAFLLGWAIPADRVSGGGLLAEGIGIHIIGRALEPMEGHGGSGPVGYLLTLPAYVPFLLLGFFPWIIHLPAALRGFITGTLGDRRARVLLWAWVLPTFAMFTLAATKLPHYIFPLYPALAIMVAATIVRAGDAPGDSAGWFLFGGWIYLAGGVATAAAIIATAFLFPDFLAMPLAVGAALALLAAVGAVARLQLRDRPLAASRVLVAATAVAFAVLVWVLIPRIEPIIKIAEPMATAAADAAGPATEIYVAGYREPSFIFYLNRPVDRPVQLVPENDQGLEDVLAAPGDVVFVATEKLLDRAQELADERQFEVIARLAAHNVNRGGQFQSLVVARRPPARQ